MASRLRGIGARPSASALDLIAMATRGRPRRAAHTIRRRKVHLCLATGKRRYRDALQAKEVLLAASWERQGAAPFGYASYNRVVRAYECHSCHGFHMTSQAAWGAAA